MGRTPISGAGPDPGRRRLLSRFGAAAIAAALPVELLARIAAAAPAALAQDEDTWAVLRAHYRLPGDWINLESGYFSIQSQSVLDAFVGHVHAVNREGARYMRTRMVQDKQRVRAELADLVGCSAQELIITRNTTESLDTVISGFDWKAGDEAVMASHDYGAMLDHFGLMARRHGLRKQVVQLPLHPRSDAEIVDVYARAITEHTRLLMVCHVVNITGQVLPVRKIAAMAHARGVQVMVDGAHAVAQLDFRIDELDADYYGASLHKWLGAPLGAGLLYVRRERIAGLWPLYGDAAFADDDIGKLNHTGTHPVHTDLAISDAIAAHRRIGSAKKAARLLHLQRYWTTRARAIEGVSVNTPDDPQRSCAIGNVAVRGMDPKTLAQRLMDEFRIYTVAIDRPEAQVRGVRVTPHLFTSPSELDTLLAALRKLAA